MHAGLKQFGGWYLPAGEDHLCGWMQKVNDVQDGRMRYQGAKLDMLLSLCRNFRTAIDAGAHCGLISHWLSKRFLLVHSFEPVELHRQAFALNVSGNVVLHAMALGDRDGSISIQSDPRSSGDSIVNGSGDIPMRRLDDMLPGIEHVDALKVDLEGFEEFALRGGEELLKRCRPAVMVEQKRDHAQRFGLAKQGAVRYLESLGARQVKEWSGDHFMRWPDA